MTGFEQRRIAAIAILTNGERLTKRAGQFLGQVAVSSDPLSERQEEWFGQLAERAGVDWQVPA